MKDWKYGGPDWRGCQGRRHGKHEEKRRGKSDIYCSDMTDEGKP
jgi:hypothetical protein